MKIIVIFILLSTIFLFGCSNKNGQPLSLSDGHFSADQDDSIKNIKDAQPKDQNEIIITKQITKKTVISDLSKKGAGMISECEYKSDLYFSVDFNNFKLPTKIIDRRGNIYATCDYQVESRYKIIPICEYLQDCKLVYVSQNNVRGYNPIDKYLVDQES